jgi:hypothetical protein
LSVALKPEIAMVAKAAWPTLTHGWPIRQRLPIRVEAPTIINDLLGEGTLTSFAVVWDRFFDLSGIASATGVGGGIGRRPRNAFHLGGGRYRRTSARSASDATPAHSKM